MPAGTAGSGSSPAAGQPTNGNTRAEPETPKKRVNPIKRKQMEDRVRELEEEIGCAEAEVARLEAALQNFVSAEESQRQSQELEQHKASHAALLKEWEEMSEALQGSD
jgi:ATP-binding cassette subfamily F protein 3